MGSGIDSKTESMLLDRIASYRDPMLEFTKALIAQRTENPPGRSYLSCVEVIAARLKELGLDYEIMEVPRGAQEAGAAGDTANDSGASVKGGITPESGGDTSPAAEPRYILVGSYGEGDRALYFHGHYDVVPGHDDRQFEPFEMGGRLYGRGASDMKGGLAAMIFAVKAMMDCGVRPKGRIGLVFVPDEETGGELGSGYLKRAGLLARNGIGMITPEPTGGAVWNANRGAITVNVSVKGKAAHVGLSYEGTNAFERMLEIAGELSRLKGAVESRKTLYSISPEQARGSILLLGGKCQGGTNFNVVPDICYFTVDRRINPEEKLKREKQRLFDIFDKARSEGVDLEVEILQEGESAGVPEDAPLSAALSGAVRDIAGEAPSFEMCPGLLETRFYVGCGVPALAYGPGLLAVSHGPDEYVSVDDLLGCASVYALTASRMLL